MWNTKGYILKNVYKIKVNGVIVSCTLNFIILQSVLEHHPYVHDIFQVIFKTCPFVFCKRMIISGELFYEHTGLSRGCVYRPESLCQMMEIVVLCPFIGSPARTTRSQSPVMSSRSPQKVWPFSCVCGLTFDVFTSVLWLSGGSVQGVSTGSGFKQSSTCCVWISARVFVPCFRLAHEWAPDRTLQKPLIHQENTQPRKKWRGHFKIIIFIFL